MNNNNNPPNGQPNGAARPTQWRCYVSHENGVQNRASRQNGGD